MSTEVKVPVLPESVSDATVDTWHKKPGDTVNRDENLVDLETDKVVLEVPAPRDGVLGKILKETGETVTSDEVLALIEEAKAEDQKGDRKKAEAEKPDKAEDRRSDQKKTEPEKQDRAEDRKAEAPKDDHPEEKAAPNGTTTARPSPKPEVGDLSPAVRRMVTENGLDPSRIHGTGRDGRLTKEDVVKYMDRGGDGGTASTATVPAGERPEKRVPMSRLRARIAERMVEAQQTAAILTSFNEVDLHRVMDLRARHKEGFEKEHGVRLGLMSFFVKAACAALKEHPVVNASVDENDIIYHGYYDIGIAVATDRGLVVPILRDADRMSFAAIERAIHDYAGKAREGGLSMEDLTGGTFTITNGGVFGSLVSTPILNPPQSAILGMHTIKERPVVEDGEIVARPMMYIALSYDHRIVDGRDAVLFLVAVKERLEQPERLLLDA